MGLKSLGLASLLPWLNTRAENDAVNDKAVSEQQWYALDQARQRREPLILHVSADKRGQGHQSLILKANRDREQLWVDIPYPDFPASFVCLSDRLFMSLRRPGAYHHWHLEGSICERAFASDGPYLKIDLKSMAFRQDRRLQPRITFGMERAEIQCTQPMERPVFGELENISAGGLCFNIRGDLHRHEGFFRSGHMNNQAVPVNITLNKHDSLTINIELLAMQVIKKPYLHTRVRARFANVTNEQRQILCALTSKPALTA